MDGWKVQAACRDTPGRLWDGVLSRAAFTMCMGCPVKVECLMEGLDHDGKSDEGVWGGTDASHRRRIRKGADPYQVWREISQTMEVA